jgi:pimeloyl-ACP methyl ester carboxylesterase
LFVSETFKTGIDHFGIDMTMIYTTEIQIFSHGALLAARIHRNVANLFEVQPGLVASGSWLTVKEQMADLYAARLAALGYTVLTFDFAGFGASAGAGRQIEIPQRKIDDIVAASRFLSSLSCVWGKAVGYVAICASAMYAAAAVERGAPIASLSCIAGWLHDTASLAGFYGGETGIALRLDRAGAAVGRVAEGKPDSIVPAYDVGNDRAGMFIELDYYANPARGRIRAWRNEMSEQTWAHWLTFDGMSAAARLTAPTLFVHGDECALPENVKRVYEQIPAEKRLVWQGGFQADFYDRPDLVEIAVNESHRHFQHTLTRAMP